MITRMFCFISLLTLLGCKKNVEVVSPLAQDKVENRVTIIYGSETTINGLIGFAPFSNQDTLNLSDLANTQNITLRIGETNVPIKFEEFDPSKVSTQFIASTEMEVIHPGGKARVRSWGSGSSTGELIFEFVVPVTVAQTPVKDNNVLDLPNINGTKLIIMYKSLWSTLSINDTLYLRQQ